MKFDKTLSRKIIHFLKNNDPKMIFIYGQNDPWTAAGVTWLKGKKEYSCLCGTQRKSFGPYRHFASKRKEEAIGLIKKWLEE